MPAKEQVCDTSDQGRLIVMLTHACFRSNIALIGQLLLRKTEKEKTSQKAPSAKKKRGAGPLSSWLGRRTANTRLARLRPMNVRPARPNPMIRIIGSNPSLRILV